MSKNMLFLKLFFAAVTPALLFGVLLFLPARTLDWWRAWVFIAVVLVCGTATMFGVMARNEELLNERYGSPVQKGQPLADKIVANLFIAAFFAVILFIPLDVFRFHILPTPAMLMSSLGLILFICGWALIAIAFSENTFAAPVVKYQEERHQAVIDTGAYAFVRHPMYSSVILLLVGMALWLESYAAALLSIVPIAAIALRIVFEEKFLKTNLPGYEAYTHRVRYRMIPFVW